MARQLFRPTAITRPMVAFKRMVTKFCSWCICTKTSVSIFPQEGHICTTSSAQDLTYPEDGVEWSCKADVSQYVKTEMSGFCGTSTVISEISRYWETSTQDPVYGSVSATSDVSHASGSLKKGKVSSWSYQMDHDAVIDINSCSYEVGIMLRQETYGNVYAGIRLTDGQKVALKFVKNTDRECIQVEGYSKAVPQEICLLILANKGTQVSQITQLLDWEVNSRQYIMVFEHSAASKHLNDFLDYHGGTIREDLAAVIMQQATFAAQTCCKRGVFHGDINLTNLLIDPETHDVTLTDFGCGKVLTSIEEYCPPEYDMYAKFHGEQATSWSLGIVLFILLCGKFPNTEDFRKLNKNTWNKDILTEASCEILCSLLQRNPEKRLKLEKILFHRWFQYFGFEQYPKYIDINSCNYKIVRKLTEGGFGVIYEGICLTDDLKVALKFAKKDDIEYIKIEGYSEAIPMEIGLLILANKGERVHQIIQLLDWMEDTDDYIMVLECPMPCENLIEFIDCHDGTVPEDVAAVIMHQATLAAQICCQRGVLHRDIKLENLLINPETHEVKLINFGCGEVLKSSSYTSYCGTDMYSPPEFNTTGEYHGKPATVWSLGILLFALLHGYFPKTDDLNKLDKNNWNRDDLSEDCCELLCSLLQRHPKNRRKLEKILFHRWFQYFGLDQEMPEIIDVNSCHYKTATKLGEEGFGTIYQGIRLTDGLNVALKFASRNGIEYIKLEGYSEAVPLEIGLLILANKGDRVPQIIQLLDWMEDTDDYIMVLECPMPCENLVEFLDRHDGTVPEDVAAVIMYQATLAAQICCQRGVLHRDIKLENLLINPETHEVKLINFGCGEVLTSSSYTSYCGTDMYSPPEFNTTGEYHGKPATVWSLGILLFGLLNGHFPKTDDLNELEKNNWKRDNLSKDCWELLCSLLQRNPENRRKLEKILFHRWFQYFGLEQEMPEIIDVNSCHYQTAKKLGEGGFGTVYQGIRLTDGLNVALKVASKDGIEYIEIEGISKAVPLEIGLLILANKGDRVPQIIQLLDWMEDTEDYIMVLECPMHCENLIEFLGRHDGTVPEDVAAVIMQQATIAAQICCQRGVLHRDIKLENLLINPETHEIKIIDFGCGDVLTSSSYKSYSGTEIYSPPEFNTTGEYHGKPATVWSLGILLFALLHGHFPKIDDLEELEDSNWTRNDLSEDCCVLLCSLLQREPENRRKLEKILFHRWFQNFGLDQKMPEIIDINSCHYKIGKQLSDEVLGSVYEGIRLNDCLKVALKFAHKDYLKYIEIEGYSEAVPMEIGLLILANKGERVPQIIQLLDWKNDTDEYIMVLDYPMPCENLNEFLDRHDGAVPEDVAAVIMYQATLAAQICCQRGVLHRDIKLESLLINPETHEVKLSDFWCGEVLTSSSYTSYSGTDMYVPPEYYTKGEYHGKPATVWSLGILLFVLLHGHFPASKELDKLNENTWTKDGLSQDCCKLLCSLLQREPEQRMDLEKVNLHLWFKYFIY